MVDEPDSATQEMRQRIFGGGRLLLDSLSDEELEAAHALILRRRGGDHQRSLQALPGPGPGFLTRRRTPSCPARLRTGRMMGGQRFTEK